MEDWGEDAGQYLGFQISTPIWPIKRYLTGLPSSSLVSHTYMNMSTCFQILPWVQSFLKPEINTTNKPRIAVITEPTIETITITTPRVSKKTTSRSTSRPTTKQSSTIPRVSVSHC